MITFLQESSKRRQLQLFGCAACRQVQRLMGDERSRTAVEVAERRADGLATEREVRAARAAAKVVYEATLPKGNAIRIPWDGAAWAARDAAGAARWVLTVHYSTTTRLAAYAPVGEKYCPTGVDEDDAETYRGLVSLEHKAQAALLREIAGNPFRPVAFDPAWRTPDAVTIAQTIYDERRFSDLPVLADALEEAGCSNPAILDHLRGPGPHPLGCWALNLILGKE
jgi:hypothetical protein